MSIGENQEKINTFKDGGDSVSDSEVFDLAPVKSEKEKLKSAIVYMGILVLVATASYGIGRISFYNSNKIPVTIKSQNSNLITPPEEKTSSDSANTASVLNASTKIEVTEGIVVGSKNSNKYHYPWCSGAKNILESNKIIFNSIEEAEASGYIPASNCKGLR